MLYLKLYGDSIENFIVIKCYIVFKVVFKIDGFGVKNFKLLFSLMQQ